MTLELIEEIPKQQTKIEVTKHYIFRCKTCNGTGKRTNPYFESCKNGPDAGKCYECSKYNKFAYQDCKKGEIINCEACGGTGGKRVSGNWFEFLKIETVEKGVDV